MINKLTQIGQPLPATFGGKAFLSPSRSYHNTTASVNAIWQVKSFF